MPRAKGGFKTRRRRKKVLEQVKGYYGAKSKLFRVATEALDKALQYAYRDRRAKKREFRSLWIVRIKSALSTLGLTYSQFIAGLKKAEVALNRKVLADMAYNDPKAFGQIVDKVKQSLN